MTAAYADVSETSEELKDREVAVVERQNILDVAGHRHVIDSARSRCVCNNVGLGGAHASDGSWKNSWHGGHMCLELNA